MAITERQLICRIAESFNLRGQGLVLCPESALPDGVVIRVGDPVALKTPDGREVQTRISSINLLTPNPNRIVPMILEGITDKGDAPIGSEVWTRPGSSE